MLCLHQKKIIVRESVKEPGLPVVPDLPTITIDTIFETFARTHPSSEPTAEVDSHQLYGGFPQRQLGAILDAAYDIGGGPLDKPTVAARKFEDLARKETAHEGKTVRLAPGMRNLGITAHMLEMHKNDQRYRRVAAVMAQVVKIDRQRSYDQTKLGWMQVLGLANLALFAVDPLQYEFDVTVSLAQQA